ncbi:MAG: hypothetical protein RL693_2237 [Verrucomicrobiota bacterium]
MNSTINKATVAAKAKRLAIKILIGVAIAVPVKASVITSFRVTGESVSAELSKGSHVLVYRLASDFQAGDIILYSPESKPFAGRFAAVTSDGFRLTRNREDVTVARDHVIGKVVIAKR